MKDFKWYERLMLGALLVMLVGGAAYSPWGRQILSAPDAPAWVQAFGSIAAILGTYWVAEKQFKRDQAHRREELDRLERIAREESETLRELVIAIAIDSVEAVFEFQNYARRHIDGSRFELRTARLDDSLYALRGLLLRPLPVGTATPVLDMQRSVSRSLRDVERFYGSKGSPDSNMQLRIQERALSAYGQAKKIPGFEAAWQERQNAAACPATVLMA
ncbi:hypothetical protein [Achromobacter xylosoxidans]|uniref:hypothetical protein n=1 Tax=Alcaligenes xylosoxydans xylosoxydans TaxID=85698 RepID=UPI000AA8BE23|nr:hypothetical protein [Achromobacter xylosoxidans]